MRFCVTPRTDIKKYMCLQEIGLHAQNVLTTLHTIFNIIKKGLHDHLMSTKILNFENAIGCKHGKVDQKNAHVH